MSTDPTPPLNAIESAKRAAAFRAVADHFDRSFRYIGIGSGSTIVYVVEAIKEILSSTSPFPSNTSHPTRHFIPTGTQSLSVLHQHSLPSLPLPCLPPHTNLDISFDGADEVDEDLNCIKGGGACHFQEKLVATAARKWICVADHRKLQRRLLSQWGSVPVEVVPFALGAVLGRLRALGSVGAKVRERGRGEGEGGKVKVETDQGNWVVDAPFGRMVLARDREVKGQEGAAGGQFEAEGEGEEGRRRQWEVEELAREIKLIEGVLSVGIFCGLNGEEMLAQGGTVGGPTPVAAYFGMANGDVVVRRKGEGERLIEKSKED